MNPAPRPFQTTGCVVPIEKRLFEWSGALMFLGLGIELVFIPTSIGSSAFRYMLEVMPPKALVVIYLAIGMVRLALLILNGRYAITRKFGPPGRAACSMFSAVVLLQMDAALIRLHFETGLPPSPGIPIYSVLFLTELFSTYRAAADGRSYCA
jgi:hypothetical protein